MPQGGAPAGLDAATVATLYASPLGANPWREAIELIADRLGAKVTAISFRVASEGLPTIGVQAFRGMGKQLWDAYQTRFGNVSPFSYDGLEVGRFYELSDSFGDPALMRHLREELLDPFGLGNTWCMPIGIRDRPVAYLVAGMAKGEQLGTERQDWCRAIMPHLARAIEGYQRMRLAELASVLAGDALGHLAIGVAAVDRNDRVLFTNSEADRIIAGSPDIGRHGGRLVMAGAELAARFTDSRNQTQATRIRGPGDSPIGLLMTPVISTDPIGPGSPPDRTIYFQDLASIPQVSERLVAELFGLSPTEARLSALLVQGQSLREAAAVLGVTENSARTYSKIVFSKLGVSRQSDLVRKVLRSVAMLGSGD